MDAYFTTRGYLFRISLDKMSGEAAPPVELVVDFRKEGMPIGMGAFVLNSKIYLVGGEMIGKDKILNRTNRPYVLDLGYGDEGVSSSIFVFDPISVGKHLSSCSGIPPMRGAKAKPKIATIGGKVYVLGSKPYIWKEMIPHPAFECYDPLSSQWEELPEPHQYRHPTCAMRMGACALSRFFFIGRRICLKNTFGLSFYDVDVREWKDITSASLPFYNHLEESTSIAEGKDGVVIAHTLGGLKAYLYGVDGKLKLEQQLCQIDDDFGRSEYCTRFVRYLGDRKFCSVLSAQMVRNISWAVRVTTFLVDVQGDACLDAVVLHSHEYDFSRLVPDSEYFDFVNVFIVGGEEALEHPLLDDVYDDWVAPLVSGPRPKPHSEHGAAIVKPKMNILGGTQDGIYLNDHHALDMRSWTWSKVEAKARGEALESASPVRVAPCARHCLIPWGVDKLILIAGLTKDPSETIEAVKLFDLQSSTWSTLKTCGKPPVSRGGQSVTLVGTRLLLFGGEDAKGSLLNDLHILDLETLTWDKIDAVGLPPSPRSYHAAAVHADRYLFIFGGSSHTACFNDLHVLDLQTMEWSRPAQQGEIPTPWAGHAGITIGES